MKAIRLGVQILFLLVFLFSIITGKTVLWLGIFLVSLLGAAVFGRFYCGYVCPMNTAMRGTNFISKKWNIKKKKTPAWMLHKSIPILVIGLMILTMVLSKKILHKNIPVLLILMFIAMFFTLFYEEWIFHNQICPYGFFLKIFGKKAVFSTRVSPELCIGCKKCEMVCPAHSIIVNMETHKAEIDQKLCHQCQACTAVCLQNAIRYHK
ncbi:MAG: 4Fe-4S binding protein [Lachnospiraceae bacterium]|nr:4Fe-4S binding protein [Lachnospiraceae bacterium]